MRKWYVVQVTTGAEQDVRMRLNRLGYPAMLPMKVMRERKTGACRDVTRMMLPGYTFVESEMQAADWHRIRHLPGVLRILGDGRPCPLAEPEAARIAWLDNGGEPWGISFAQGDGSDYVIKSGPLTEYASEIISVDRRGNRARIRASVLGEAKHIDLALIFEDDDKKQSEEPEG